MKTLPKVASEMALSVLAYDLTRVLKHRRHQAADCGDQGVGMGILMRLSKPRRHLQPPNDGNWKKWLRKREPARK